MKIAVDFDGTIVTHEYPYIGKPVPHAIETLQELVSKGHEIILWTMRSGRELDKAVEYLRKNNIPLYGINENPKQKSWTLSPKAYAPIYIDDAALGCPLIYGIHSRPIVNWRMIRVLLIEKGVL